MSSITRTLAVPLVSQLHEPTQDGQPDENADDNCLFASSASALMGYHPSGPTYDGDEIKDAVMGQGYTGFGYFSAKLTAYLAANGVAITVETGAPSLASVAHSFIDRGIPLLAVIPSLWGVQQGAISPSFSTHVVLLCGDGAGWLRAMNPWGGFWQDQPDGWWASRFCYGALWALIPASGVGIGSTAGGNGMAGGIPAGWHDDGTTLTAPNGVPTSGAFRTHILTAAQWSAALMPLAPLYGIGGGDKQDFALSLEWASASDRVSEVPGHAGPDYAAQVAALTAQLAAANAEIAHLKANPPVSTPSPAPEPTPAPAPAPSAAEIAAATIAALAAKLAGA